MDRDYRGDTERDWAQEVPDHYQNRGPYRDWGWERGQSSLPQFRDPSVHQMPYDDEDERAGRYSSSQSGSRRGRSQVDERYGGGRSMRNDRERYGYETDFSGVNYGAEQDSGRGQDFDYTRRRGRTQNDYRRTISGGYERGYGAGQGPSSGFDRGYGRYGNYNRDRGPESGGYGDYGNYGRNLNRGYDRDFSRGSESGGYGGYGESRGYGGRSQAYGSASRQQGGFAGGFGPHSGKGPRGYQRADERIQEDVCELLTQHGYIDASEIEVAVSNGEVTLSGNIDSRRTRRLVEEVIEVIPGIRDIHNQLRVQQSGTSGRSTTSAMIGRADTAGSGEQSTGEQERTAGF